MTGLEWEIKKQQVLPLHKRKITISKIAEMLNYSYPTVKSKIKTGDFSVNEALAIMSLFFKGYSLEILEYLFTPQNDVDNYKIVGDSVVKII